APPRGVRLRDDRDSVRLSWAYPEGAEGPVLVAGGRVGQEQRTLQTLPPGSTSVPLHGLPPDVDYCFTVAVVYSTDVVVPAPPVCTRRRAASTAPAETPPAGRAG
ncbi:MAG TPA: fibronectin type III domain-containing protein, partial [Pilimelia sp.]|nr:fibronectin type III domain-containing protein [Pilimelia sp.]